MDKAILIIDMPNSCKECPLCEVWEAIPSVDEYSCIIENISVDKYDRPDWCPLKPAPEKQFLWHDDERDDWAIGYNNCLSEILGE